MAKAERLWRDKEKLAKVLDQRLDVTTFDELHDSVVNVKAFYMQVLCDFVTFGIACPLLGLVVALSILFSVTRWGRLVQSLVLLLESEQGTHEEITLLRRRHSVGQWRRQE